MEILTKIDGLTIKPTSLHTDDRGHLFEVIHDYDMEKFGQVYVVEDPTRGIIRAFHKHEKLWDYFCIIQGAAKFVFVDDRPDSKTYKKKIEVIASGRNPELITVPPGIYHGYISLEDKTILLSIASEVYNAEDPDEKRIPYDSYGKDVWPIKFK